MQEKVGPTMPPRTGRSANPPTNRSMSSTVRYAFRRRFVEAGPITRSRSDQSFTPDRPHGPRQLTYAGRP
uniref:Uncharacterized protein n=1 Tax=Anopheles atroparvus TaxID=41427 RepID=A0AAG5CSP9_ANOAO